MAKQETQALQKRVDGLKYVLAKNFKSIESVLPSHMDGARFCRMALNAALRNPELTKADPNTFAMAVINCAEMGLEPGLDEAAFVPRGGTVDCEPQWQGLLKLCRNTGEVAHVFASVVLKGELFEVEEGFQPSFKHVKDPNLDRDKDEELLMFSYAGAVLKDGTRYFIYMNRKQVEARRNTSHSWSSSKSAWKQWPGKMWQKTALKELFKLLPKSTQLQRAIALDDQFLAGIKQTPALADLSGFEGNLDVLAGEPVNALPKAPERIAEPEPVPQEQADVGAEFEKLYGNAKITGPVWAKILKAAEIDEARDISDYSDEEKAKLVHLMKATVGDG